MFSKTMNDAFNKQLNAELYSGYLYLSMAAYLEGKNFSGMATWMQMQAEEELGHAMKFFHRINERGGCVQLDTINAPQQKWNSLDELFQEVYTHECTVSKLIHDLVDLADKEKDKASHSFLQWFVEEQVEEEASALAILEKIKLIKDSGSALYMLDIEMGKRGDEKAE